MPSARLVIPYCLLWVVFAGCGDDESGGARPSTPKEPAAAEKGSERAGTATAASPAQSKTRDHATATEHAKRSASAGGKQKERSHPQRRPAAEAVQEAARKRAKQGEPRRRAPRRSAKAKRHGGTTSGGPSATPAPLTGRALRRCVLRAARQTGRRRLRAQARCVGMSPAELARLIRTQCRRVGRSPAAGRRCERVALGGPG